MSATGITATDAAPMWLRLSTANSADEKSAHEKSSSAMAAKHNLQIAQEIDCKENSPSSYNSGDVKEQAQMQLSQESVSLFHRVADDNVTSRIFTFLPLENLARVSRVCKKWNKLASHNTLWNSYSLCKQFPSLKILDEKTWETYVDLKKFGLVTSDVPPLDKRAIIPTLKRLLTLPIEGNAGITLLTIPKGLSLYKLSEIIISPKQGNAMRPISGLKNLGNTINGILGSRECLKTYRVAITNSILNESRDKSVDEQHKLVKASGFKIPEVITVTTLCCLTYISSHTRLYSYSTGRGETYTLCLDTLRGFTLESSNITIRAPEPQGAPQGLSRIRALGMAQIMRPIDPFYAKFKELQDSKITVGGFGYNHSNEVAIEFKTRKAWTIGIAAQWKLQAPMIMSLIGVLDKKLLKLRKIKPPS